MQVNKFVFILFLLIVVFVFLVINVLLIFKYVVSFIMVKDFGIILFLAILYIGWRFINYSSEESSDFITPIYRIWTLSRDTFKYLYEQTLNYIALYWHNVCHFFKTHLPNLPKFTRSALNLTSYTSKGLSYTMDAIKNTLQYILVFFAYISENVVQRLSDGFCNVAHLFWLTYNQTTSYQESEKISENLVPDLVPDIIINSHSSNDLEEKLHKLEKIIQDEKLKRDAEETKLEAIIKEYYSIIQKHKLDSDLASRRCCRVPSPSMQPAVSLSSSFDTARFQEIENLVSAVQETSSAHIAEIRNEINSIASSRTNDLDSYKGSLDLDQIKTIILEAIKTYDADKTGRADYALESAGGRVVSIRCTKTYTNKGYTSWGFPTLWSSFSVPEDAIRPSMAPGECWAFYGSVGYLVLELSYQIKVTGFTIEHIDKLLSPYGSIDSAPQHLSMWGLKDADDLYEQYLFGDYVFEDSGRTIQYFPVKNPTDIEFKFVELKIISNHGHPDYTCLYRIRVHGAVS